MCGKLQEKSDSAFWCQETPNVSHAPKTLKKGENMNAEFKIGGIHCKSCIALIKMNIEEIKGISEISGNNDKGTLKVKYDEKTAKLTDIIKAIEQDGYKVESYKESKN